MVRNPNTDPVAFKVKTTAPRQYCVRPNSGRIEAGAEVEVQVLLQAMKEDPPLDYKCRDKFLVQSLAITADRETTPVADIWTHVDKEGKSAHIHECKIRCSFLPGGGGGDDVGVNGVSHRSSLHSVADDSREEGLSQRFSSAAPELQPASPLGAAPSPLAQGAIARDATVGTTSASSPASTQNLELAKAQEEIVRLKNEIQESTLSLRKSAASSTGVPSAKKGSTGQSLLEASQRGVPVPLVATLCLLTFMLAYLFF